MKLQRLAPSDAFTINQVITEGERPEWASGRQITRAQKESEKFIEEHLKVKDFDVYLAATLRNVNDFIYAERIALILENVYGFTVAYPGGLGLPKDSPADDSSNEKGDLERYFIEKSKSLLMFEAEKMSVGKYFEAAIAILSRKPIVLVFNNFVEANILKMRHPIKTLGATKRSYGFHIAKSLGEATGCLKAELGLDPKFDFDFRQLLNEINTMRSENGYCPLCKSLLVRSSSWIAELEDRIQGKEKREQLLKR